MNGLFGYVIKIQERKNWMLFMNKEASKPMKNLKIKLLIFILLLAPPVTGIVQLWINRHFPWAAYLYLIASLMAFYGYWSDKRRAGTDARRIPEARLHLLELLGGWAGALIAQQLFRHKTRKVSFQFIFWLIVFAHELFWLDQLCLNGKYLGGIQ